MLQACTKDSSTELQDVRCGVLDGAVAAASLTAVNVFFFGGGGGAAAAATSRLGRGPKYPALGKSYDGCVIARGKTKPQVVLLPPWPCSFVICEKVDWDGKGRVPSEFFFFFVLGT